VTSPELRRASAHLLVDDVEAPSLSDAAAHHLFRVLRVRDGEAVTVTDGLGRWRSCVAAGASLVAVDDVQVQARRDPLLTVGFAIPKHDRPGWIVQKLTELGIDRIVPVHAERSVVRWSDDRSRAHVHKLRRVAAEALQQSRGVWLPDVVEPVPAVDLLRSAAAAEPDGRPIAPGDRAVVIGPEGGWSPAELDGAVDAVSVGATILRVETAAVVVGTHLVMHAE